MGQYVTYDGGLYRFIKTHSGAWASGDVIAVNVGGELYGITNALIVNNSPVGIENIFQEIDTDSYRGITVSKAFSHLCFDGTASGNARFKLSGTIDHAVSVQDSWKSERLPVITGRKYKLIVIILGGTFSGSGSPQIAIVDSEGNTTANVVFAENGALKSGSLVSEEFTATATNCAFVSCLFSSGAVCTNIKIAVALYDSDNVAVFLSDTVNAINAKIYNETQEQNGAVGFYNNVPKITSSGTSLIVSIPANVRGYNKIGAIVNNTSAADYTIPTGSCLVLYTDTKTFDVIEIVNIGSLEHPFIVCVYNSRGVPIGPWAYHYNTGALQSEIDALNDVPPTYYFTDSYIDNKVAAINTIGCELGRQAIRLFFVTDFHKEENACLSPVLVNYLKDKTGIRNIIFNGDYYTKDLESKIGGYNRLTDFLALALTVEEGSNVYYITGNHEFNDPSAQSSNLRLTENAVFQLLNEPKHYDIVSFDGTNSFYFDDSSTKIRVYCIDCDYSSTISVQARKDIFASLLEVPEGYAVLICSHTGTTASSGSVTGLTGRFEQIMSVFAAMNDGTSITVSLGGDYTYDFTGKQRTFIGALTGHQHADGYYIYDDRFPVILTTCDAYDATQYPANHGRTAGTITEQAFDVVQVDVLSKRIYCTRIGYGVDRTFSFGTNAGLIT